MAAPGPAARGRGAGAALALWAWLVPLARAVVLEGRLPQTRNFATIVGKFCFDYLRPVESIVGEINIDLIREGMPTERPSGKLFFVIFDDEHKHWRTAHRAWDQSTCEEKIEQASDHMEMNLQAMDDDSKYIIRIREHLRPRFWYFSFVACDGLQLEQPLRYRVHASNPRWGWQSEFSLDHMGMFAVHAVFAAAFTVATLVTAWASRWRSGVEERLKEHPYMQMLLLSYIASSASCVFFLAHYMLFISDGRGSLRIRFLGVVCSTVANCTIFLIAILSSAGWAISTFALPARRCFLGGVALVGGITALCELRAETTAELSPRLYAYQSGPGVLLLMLKIFIFCWFAYQTKLTFDEEIADQRRRFYKVLGVSITGWSMNVPVTVVLAFAVSPWYRYKIVASTEVVARFLGQVLLSQLFCGPWSPITAQNTFSVWDDQSGSLDSPFDQMVEDNKRFGSL